MLKTLAKIQQFIEIIQFPNNYKNNYKLVIAKIINQFTTFNYEQTGGSNNEIRNKFKRTFNSYDGFALL